MSVSFEQFVVAASPRLVHAARMLLGSAAEAEDMTQETLILMHRHWARLRQPEAADAYAYRILVRLSRRHLRSARFRHEAPEGAIPICQSNVVNPPREHNDELLAALNELPARQRETLILRYYLDLSINETAQVMRCSAGTVKSQVNKGLGALRHQLRLSHGETQAGRP